VAIVGLGVDVVDIERFGGNLERTPALRERLFAPSERELTLQSLAARFAAKEALVKAIGSESMRWVDIEIPKSGEAPRFVFSGDIAERVRREGLSFHLSLSHDGGIAMASVIAESAA
jgi:holo-[acyl-carrier protein] synthase